MRVENKELNRAERVRTINETEKEQLMEYMKENFPEFDSEDPYFWVNGSHIVVLENYMTDCPGYRGKVIILIYGEPCYYDLLIEKDGELVKVEREN